MGSLLEWVTTIGQFCSIVIIPIAFEYFKHRDKKADIKREESKKEREETDKKIGEIHRIVLLTNASSKSTMRYMLQRRHAEYMMQGYITSLQLDEFNADFEVYSAQGGNGTARKWWEEVNGLKVDDSKHPKNLYLEMLKQQQDL